MSRVWSAALLSLFAGVAHGTVITVYSDVASVVADASGCASPSGPAGGGTATCRAFSESAVGAAFSGGGLVADAGAAGQSLPWAARAAVTWDAGAIAIALFATTGPLAGPATCGGSACRVTSASSFATLAWHAEFGIDGASAMLRVQGAPPLQDPWSLVLHDLTAAQVWESPWATPLLDGHRYALDLTMRNDGEPCVRTCLSALWLTFGDATFATAREAAAPSRVPEPPALALVMTAVAGTLLVSRHGRRRRGTAVRPRSITSCAS